MLLTEFFNQSEGDSGADYQATKKVAETQQSSKKDPCWKGYNMDGTKTKGNKTVPNCVPVRESSMEGIDTVSVDVPLLIRLLEYAREDAQTDMDLHNVAERAIRLSQEGRTLNMQDYDNICPSKE
jgi:hypothetical protein